MLEGRFYPLWSKAGFRYAKLTVSSLKQLHVTFYYKITESIHERYKSSHLTLSKTAKKKQCFFDNKSIQHGELGLIQN